MNVNGSKFHLLLGDDWGRCTVAPAAGPAVTLAHAWQAGPVPDVTPSWDAQRNEIRLWPLPTTLPLTAGETPPVPEGRRAAAADAAGNVYRIADDHAALLVWSVAGQAEAPFWPDKRTDPSPLSDVFTPIDPAAAALRVFGALAVTDDQYLLATATGADGTVLLAFDLTTGGAPALLPLPTGRLAPFDMARRAGGGAWLLEREQARLWEFDARFALVPVPGAPPPSSPTPDPFQPLNPVAGARPRTIGQEALPPGLDLRAALAPDLDPIAIDTLPNGAVAVLDRGGSAGRSRVFVLRAAQDAGPPLLLPGLAQDIVAAGARTRGASNSPLLLAAAGSGNQAWAYTLGANGLPAPGLNPELYPLRRFGGRAFVAVRGFASYDSGPTPLRWVPVVQQPRLAYRPIAVFNTPVLDGAEPACLWDRVLLDAVIPPGATVTLEARAGDARYDPGDGGAEAVTGPWITQPAPYLRPGGPEIPWLRQDEALPTRNADGTGTWDLLLQQARGRYLQLRLTLGGPGTCTPALRALRAWYPRFSYPARFLPAVFREDPSTADFLDRFLANIEGMQSGLEERVATIQVLFDARTAPPETLDWLASWFDLALDPSWEEWRRRLLIRHAMDYFRWRGTVHGLLLALGFAFGTGLPSPPFGSTAEAALFSDPTLPDQVTRQIRIVEAYLTRRVGPVAAGDPDASRGLRTVATAAQWTPAEGNAGLVERWAAAQGRTASFAEQVLPFSLVPPTNAATLAQWQALTQSVLGFVPAAGADERTRWQAFLRSISDSLAALSARHGRAYADWAAIDLPADEPTAPLLAQDWQAFCAASADVTPLGRWQGFLARRWRRVSRLNAAWQTSWPDFGLVALPDHLPPTASAQADWLTFERQVLALAATAHRFSVLLPVTPEDSDPDTLRRRLALAQRIVAQEKPAHTVFDVRLYWALNRVGEARLGLDTLLGAGSRAPELIPDARLGSAALGASFVAGAPPQADPDRVTLRC